jgi:hypothetical protein
MGLFEPIRGRPCQGWLSPRRGLQRVTITDMDGSYAIIVDSEDPVLIFSFVGYERMEVPVNENKEVNVVLLE